MVTLINPIPRAEPFDHGDWLLELKFDGFRAAADTVSGRLISRNGHRMQRFEAVFDLLPKGTYSTASWWCSMTPGPAVQRAAVRAAPADLRSRGAHQRCCRRRLRAVPGRGRSRP
jgi:hypothetical protein